jgi:hypothetical protein
MLMGNTSSGSQLSAGLQLCNGRMIIREMSDYNNCYILTGTCKCHDVFTPRRDLAPSDSNLPSVMGS